MDTKHHCGPASIALMTAGCLSLFGVMALLAGCGAGAGSGNGGNSISVSITNKVPSAQAGTAAVVFLATVQNDSSNSGVSWSLTANGAPCSPGCGTLSLATPTTVTYAPPSSAPPAPSNQPTLTATSVAKTNKSDSDVFTITPALVVSITNKFASVNTGASAFVVNATVQNDPTNSGLTWALTANGTACSPACGSLSGATATSVTYAPSTSVPPTPNNQPTLIAKSVHDSSKSDSDNFSIQQPPIVVTIEGKISSAVAGSSRIPLAANVQNDSFNRGTNWTLTVSGTDCQPTCGSLSFPGGSGSGTVYYTPPTSAAPPNDKPTLSAISISDSTKSDSDTFTITPTPPISVTITQVGSVLAGATGGVTFSANVQNDFNNPPQGVTWALTAGSSPCSGCGTLSNITATSVTYTPPASVPFAPDNQPTLTATSVANGTKSGSDTFTITSSVTNSCGSAGGSEGLLKGHYALLMEGFEGSAGTPILVAAGFAANGGGGITSGEEDINDTISPQHLTLTASGSLYTIGADHRGCVQLTNTGGTTAVFHFALGGINSGIASKGRIIEFDDNSSGGKGSRGSGILRLQDPNSFVLSALQNQYAFGVNGWAENNGQFLRFGAAGSFSNSGGSLTNGTDDLDFGGIVSSDVTGIDPGTINPISPINGRTTGSFDIFDWAIYMVNSSEFFVIGTDPASNATVAAGRAIATGSSFTASSVSGNYVIHATGSTNGSANASLDLLTMTPGGAQAGTLSGTVNSYGAGNGAQTITLSGVTYNVDPSAGRVSLGNPGDNLPVLYLTTPTDGIAAFVVGAGADALFGVAEPQTSTALPAGTYLFGTEDPSDNTVTNKAGVETIASGGGLAGTYDQSNTSGLLPGRTVSATVSLGSDGTGNVGQKTVAITSGSKLFSIDETGGTSGPAVIVVAEQ